MVDDVPPHSIRIFLVKNSMVDDVLPYLRLKYFWVKFYGE